MKGKWHDKLFRRHPDVRRRIIEIDNSYLLATAVKIIVLADIFIVDNYILQYFEQNTLKKLSSLSNEPWRND